ncbi:MAG TPA: hypothetical protein VGQ90_15550 [Stellaceae bacterium]|nr:hypothetical protein [Stellaceae bacterium]
MRAMPVVSLLALLWPVFALAQSQPPPAGPPAGASAAPAAKKGGDIRREDYVARAKSNAERRFDRMDADHDGVLTWAERQAYRAGHARHHASKSQ